MPGKPIKIGPFAGGLNSYSAVTAVEDSQVVDIQNFDIDLDGSLLSRPPVIVKTTTPAAIHPLGYFKDVNGAYFLIGASATTTYQFDGATWAVITATFGATSFVQYGNKAWLVAPPGSANPGGTWDVTAGFVAIAAMKKGNSCVLYKERMFIAEGGTGATSSRMYFSNPANLAVWSGADFLDVSAGDGQSIIELRVFTDTIVAFKDNSTYIYSYDSAPTRGAVRVISTSIGVAGKDCVVEYENQLYILHNKGVYAVLNWNYDKLNTLVPFVFVDTIQVNTTYPQTVSILNDRLVIRYFDKIYVFGLKTRVWTTWKCTSYFHKFYALPGMSTATQEFFSTSADNRLLQTLSFLDTWNVTRTEVMDVFVVTKTFQFDTPYGWKKLSWWGIDLLTKSNILGQVFPITYGTSVTWDGLKNAGRTWGSMLNNTWARPLDIAINVDNNFTTTNVAENRMFLKFSKALRFRQVNFKISGTYNGTSTQGPYRIYSLSAFTYTKEIVAKTVN